MTNDSPTGAPVAGLSGKSVTLCLVATLLVLGSTMSYTLWTYGQLDLARKETSTSWRALTDQLSARYRSAEQVITPAGQGQKLPLEFQERFLAAVDRFRTTSLADEQFQAALEVESLLSDGKFQSDLNSAESNTTDLNRAVEEYNSRLRNQAQLLNGLGGRFLQLFVKFPDPQPFVLAEAS